MGLVDKLLIGRKLAEMETYEKINPAIVIAILRKNLTDFEKYKKTIIKYI